LIVTHVIVIAEAGVNHNGDMGMAKALIDAAANAGADVVKFQTFNAGLLVTRAVEQAEYQQQATGTVTSQYEMLKKLELSDQDHKELIAHCSSRGIAFLSTPFDHNSLRRLTQEFGVERLKIGSGDMTNYPLVLEAARTKLPIIMSCGMATMAEIELALGALAYGYTGGEAPTPNAFRKLLNDPKAHALLKKNVVLLHCTTAYPAPYEDISLRAMETLRHHFKIPVGFSDHSEGNAVSVAATALGACVIEKHITLDRTLPGPDHRASIEPDALAQLVRDIRIVTTALGNAEKRITGSEEKNKHVARKSLHANAIIRTGDIFNADNLSIKRPETGLSPEHYWRFLGCPATRDYDLDEAITEDLA
jgi:N-acetylneuraminate synthase